MSFKAFFHLLRGTISLSLVWLLPLLVLVDDVFFLTFSKSTFFILLFFFLIFCLSCLYQQNLYEFCFCSFGLTVAFLKSVSAFVAGTVNNLQIYMSNVLSNYRAHLHLPHFVNWLNDVELVVAAKTKQTLAHATSVCCSSKLQ